jgi:hypothetical protein
LNPDGAVHASALAAAAADYLLADLAVTLIPTRESVEIRSDKLVWFGALPGEPTPMTIPRGGKGSTI